jgi:hypothetical protein
MKIPIISTTLALYVFAPAQATTVCEPQRVIGDGNHWSWRIIDDRKCWYPGQPGKPKDELTWESTQPSPAPEAESVGVSDGALGSPPLSATSEAVPPPFFVPLPVPRPWRPESPPLPQIVFVVSLTGGFAFLVFYVASLLWRFFF